MAQLTILLDFDGTLVDQHREEAYLGLVGEHAIAQWKEKAQAYAKALYQHDKQLCAQGEFNRGAVLQEFRKGFPHVSAEEFCRAYWEKIARTQELIGGAGEALESLREAGHRLVCATDSDGIGGNKRKRVMDAELGLAEFFEDRIFIGSEDGLPKKGTPAYVEHIVLALRAEKNRCVMVGDKPMTDLVPARDVGLSTVLVVNKEYQGLNPSEYGWSLGTPSPEGLPAIIKGLTGAVAVSYGDANEDKGAASRLLAALQDKGIRALRNERCTKMGTTVATSITDAVRSLDVFVIVVTKATTDAAWCRREMELAAGQAGSRYQVLFALDGLTSLPVPGLSCIELKNDLSEAVQKIGQSLGRARPASSWDTGAAVNGHLKPFYEHWRHLDAMITQRATLFVLANTVLFLAFGERSTIHIPTVTCLAVVLNVLWMVMSQRTLRSLDDIRQVISEAEPGTTPLALPHLLKVIDDARRRGRLPWLSRCTWLSRPLRIRASWILCVLVPSLFIITWVICGALVNLWSLVALAAPGIVWLPMAACRLWTNGPDQQHRR